MTSLENPQGQGPERVHIQYAIKSKVKQSVWRVRSRRVICGCGLTEIFDWGPKEDLIGSEMDTSETPYKNGPKLEDTEMEGHPTWGHGTHSKEKCPRNHRSIYSGGV